MKVSVIVPVYNLEKHIERCLDSLLSQNFEHYEIIVVDDGSTDNTGPICDEYAIKYDFIKVIHKSNGGVSSSRNEGIKLSCGKYIMFVDGDDYVTPNYISTMYNYQIKYPDCLIVCDMWKKTAEETNYKSFMPSSLKDFTLYSKDDYFILYKTGISGYPFNKIYDKSKISSSDLLFDTSLELGEDAVFVSNYLKSCSGFVIVSEPLYYYCILPTGAISKYRKEKFNQIIVTFSARLQLISPKYLTEFCDIFLWEFISCLNNTFDKRNTDSFFKKIKYNNSILKSKEFIYCLENASKKNESPKFIKLLQRKNYFWIYLIKKINKYLKK